MKVKSESVRHSVESDSFETPWTVARQAPLSMGFSRQEYWSMLPFSSPGDHPNPGLNPGLLHCRHILYHVSYQGSSGEPDTITGSLKERYKRVSVRQKVMSWWKQRERERKDLKMLHCRLWRQRGKIMNIKMQKSLGRQKGQGNRFSWSLQKEHSPKDSFQTSSLQICKLINVF